MAQKILFTAGKGGVGTTTCVLGIGKALAEDGYKTLVVDGDFKSACALTVCGLDNMQVFTLGDFEKGGCRAKQTLVSVKNDFYIMPTVGSCTETTIERAICEIEGLFDYILCDCCALRLCDKAIVVCDPYTPSIKGADVKISYLLGKGKKEISLIVNKVCGALIFDGDIVTPEEAALILHVPLTAAICEDLSLAIGKRHARTAKAFKIAEQNITGKSKKICSAVKGYGGAFGYFKRRARRGL